MAYDHQTALLWDVVLGDASWADALAAISQTTSDSKVFLLRMSSGQSPEFRTHGFDLAAAQRDGESLAELLDPAGNAIGAYMATAPAGAVYDRRTIISDQKLLEDEGLARFREQEVFHGLLTNLRDPRSPTGFWIGLPEDRADDCAVLSRSFETWITPLEKALRASALLDEAAQSVRNYAEALARANVAAVVVSSDLRILDANSDADRMLADGDGLGCRLGRLSLVSARQQQDLLDCVTSVWQSAARDGGVTLRAPRPSRLPAYLLDVIPARGGDAAAVVLISDPMQANSIPESDAVARRFGLTIGEARVARLAPMALSKARVAEELGLSENTVRTHLASARQKLGARNMIELALIMSRP